MTESNPLKKEEVIDGTLRNISYVNRLTGHNDIHVIRGTKCKLDRIIVDMVGKSRKAMLDEICDYVNRKKLVLTGDDSEPGGFEIGDLEEIDYFGLEDFADQYDPRRPEIGLKKLNSFRTYLANRVNKIINHPHFADAREVIAKQNDPKIGRLFRNGLNKTMPKLDYLTTEHKQGAILYHGVRMVADNERDLSPDDEFEDVTTAISYANSIEDKVHIGIKARASTYNLPTIEGVEVTPYVARTQGLAVISFPLGVDKVWLHPSDSQHSNLQIFQRLLRVPGAEVLIKDASFLTPEFLKDRRVIKDVMALAARSLTAFQNYLAELTARLDAVGVPYKYVDINGDTRQFTGKKTIPEARSSGNIAVHGSLASTNEEASSNVIKFDFKTGTRS